MPVLKVGEHPGETRLLLTQSCVYTLVKAVHEV